MPRAGAAPVVLDVVKVLWRNRAAPFFLHNARGELLLAHTECLAGLRNRPAEGHTVGRHDRSMACSPCHSACSRICELTRLHLKGINTQVGLRRGVARVEIQPWQGHKRDLRCRRNVARPVPSGGRVGVRVRRRAVDRTASRRDRPALRQEPRRGRGRFPLQAEGAALRRFARVQETDGRVCLAPAPLSVECRCGKEARERTHDLVMVRHQPR